MIGSCIKGVESGANDTNNNNLCRQSIESVSRSYRRGASSGGRKKSPKFECLKILVAYGMMILYETWDVLQLQQLN